MLYVFYGSGDGAVREAAYAKLDALRANWPDLNVTKLDPDEYETGLLASAGSTVSLFGAPQAYLLDTPSLVTDFWTELEQEVAALAASPHHFIVIEGTLLAAQKKPLAAAALEMTEYKGEGTERFDTFKMANALVEKDKRTLWIYLQDAVAADLPAEEIIGVLWWQLKTLRLALITKSAAEAGVKDFPYNKAKRALSNFKPGEVEALSRSLLKLYHDGHAGKTDINLALEEWVLRI
jgi:DNA polymerase III delta subunit